MKAITTSGSNYHHTVALEEVASAVMARDYKDPPTVLRVNGGGGCDEVSHSIRANAANTFRDDSMDFPCRDQRVRRLTPMECERLQGYPDGWTDIGEWTDTKGKMHKTSDSARYKAIGNSIAIPFWRWLSKRISAQYDRTPTMASLFDGIGGFPKVWEETNGPGTALWASEIEEFCIAVTKRHFVEE